MKLIGITAAGFVLAAMAMFAQAPAAHAQEFSVRFQWSEGMASCLSPVSPEIALAGVPDGTARLAAKMVDLDFTGFNHGGGTVAYGGGETISEGALKDGYRGPCPPTPHRYRITVQALGAGGEVLATSSHTEKFPQ
jgi:phosphatidylethanolamine-binding protein (PEBP) family uncharacterized protein